MSRQVCFQNTEVRVQDLLRLQKRAGARTVFFWGPCFSSTWQGTFARHLTSPIYNITACSVMCHINFMLTSNARNMWMLRHPGARVSVWSAHYQCKLQPSSELLRGIFFQFTRIMDFQVMLLHLRYVYIYLCDTDKLLSVPLTLVYCDATCGEDIY